MSVDGKLPVSLADGSTCSTLNSTKTEGVFPLLQLLEALFGDLVLLIGILLIGSLFYVGKGFDEVPENLSRHHNGIAISTYIFSDFDHPSSGIFLKV
jgi:hypothetical protein